MSEVVAVDCRQQLKLQLLLDCSVFVVGAAIWCCNLTADAVCLFKAVPVRYCPWAVAAETPSVVASILYPEGEHPVFAR